VVVAPTNHAAVGGNGGKGCRLTRYPGRNVGVGISTGRGSGLAELSGAVAVVSL